MKKATTCARCGHGAEVHSARGNGGCRSGLLTDRGCCPGHSGMVRDGRYSREPRAVRGCHRQPVREDTVMKMSCFVHDAPAPCIYCDMQAEARAVEEADAVAHHMRVASVDKRDAALWLEAIVILAEGTP